MNKIKKYKWTLFFLLIVILISFYNLNTGLNIIKIAGENFKTLLLIIPPIFIFIGLIDVWIPKEIMMRHMGEESGLKGLIFAFLLGTMGVGPLYAAFPISALLIKKGVKYTNVIFFLSIWMSAKLPLLLVESSSLGYKFTFIHLTLMTAIYLLGSYLIDKNLDESEKELITKSIDLIEK